MAGAATGPEFDPRYDPRFQRGWTPSESDGAPPPERAAPPERVAPPPERVAPPPAPERPDPPTSGGPVSPFAPPEDRAVAAEIGRAEADGRPRADDPPGASGARGATPAGSEPRQAPASATLASVDEAAEQDSARIIRLALGSAWAIAGAATLIGLALVWPLAMDDPYGVTANETEMIVRTFAQFLAPSLFSTGLLGIVVLVVIDGVRRARRLGVPHVGAGGRSS